jgi:hypothetical protein
MHQLHPWVHPEPGVLVDFFGLYNMFGGGAIRSWNKNESRDCLLEESVAENHISHISCAGVIQNIFVNEEEKWHVHFFPGQQLLLFKAEAFNLGKVWSDLNLD